MRYVGGALSHQGEATIQTSNATIGIRGGTTTVNEGSGGTTAINHFGTITISNGGGTVVINLPGYEVTITGWNIPPGQPTKVTDAEIRHYLRLLTSKTGQNGGGPNPGTLGNFECGGPAAPPCPVPPWFPTDTGQNNANQIIVQGTQARNEPAAAATTASALLEWARPLGSRRDSRLSMAGLAVVT